MKLDVDGRRAAVLLGPGLLSEACVAALQAEGVAVEAAGTDHVRSAPVDILVAQLPSGPPGPLGEVAPERWEAAWSMLEAIADRYRHVIPGMKEQGWGRIVLLGRSSAKALVTTPSELDHVIGLGALGLHKTLAGELGPYGITVNTVLTGSDDTARPADVAALVTYLASVPAAFVNGVTIVCDGASVPALL